jgi:hypothetical protein
MLSSTKLVVIVYHAIYLSFKLNPHFIISFDIIGQFDFDQIAINFELIDIYELSYIL